MVSTVTNDPRVIVRGDISYTSKMGGGRVGWDRDSAMSYRTPINRSITGLFLLS